MRVKGTQTEKNLLASFAGESQARNRYSFYASKAKKEGFVQIGNIFEETAANEREHAKRFFSYLEGGVAEITATYPAGIIGCTLDNLKESAMGENEEHTKLYPEAAETADKEGFPEIAAQFRSIAKVEVEHEKRFRKLIDNIEKELVFKRNQPVRWKCTNCGYVHEGTEALKLCPSCFHAEKYFEIKETNY